MRFLVTNDDGIDADGIRRLAIAAAKIGEVWVVAPESQRSACSHSITLNKPIEVFPHDLGIDGVKAFSCTGTPADCVRVGTLNVMDGKPDAVLSGINFGYNVATDVQYSGTVGAAFEGCFQGYKSIAFSEPNQPDHEITDRYLDELLKESLEVEYEFGKVININFPYCKLSEFKGVLRDRTVSKGAFYSDSYKRKKMKNGGESHMVVGDYVAKGEEGTDMEAVLNNYISVGIVNNCGC